MYSISNEIGKIVISLYEMKKVGIAYNILFSSKTKKAKYILIEDEEDDYSRWVVDVKDIYSFGNDMITIKNLSCIQPYENLDLEISGYYNPIFDTIITVDGKNSGFVKDVTLTPNFSISAILDQNQRVIPIKDVLCFNHHTLILKDKKGGISLSNFKPNRSLPTPTETQLVSIQEYTSSTPNQQNLVTPSKAIINDAFLLGKYVQKDIYLSSGELIIKGNTKINSSTIDKALTFGKLKELIEASSIS